MSASPATLRTTTAEPASGPVALLRPEAHEGQGTPAAAEMIGVHKRFGETMALAGVDLSVAAGTVFGLLGPNGAGKTTAVRVLTTLLPPDAGTARVLGHDVVTEGNVVRRRIALTGQFASVDEDLSGFENLVLVARLLGLARRPAKSRASELLAAFELTDAASRQVKTYSGGMRRRLDLAASMIVRPEVLFLDEPTTGLDPRSRSQVWEIVRAIVADGSTVVLTTQNLDEADQLADRLAVIDRGQIVAEGTTGELKAQVGSGALRVRLADPSRRPEAQRLLSQVLAAPVVADGDPLAVVADLTAGQGRSSSSERAASAIAELAQAGIGVGEFSLGQPTLDEVFLALTGRPALTAHHHEKGPS